MKVTSKKMREVAGEALESCNITLKNMEEIYGPISTAYDLSSAPEQMTRGTEAYDVMTLVNCTKGMFEFVKENIDWENDKFVRVVTMAIFMAGNTGQLIALDTKRHKTAVYEKTVSAIVGKHNVERGRWKHINTLKQSLVSQAETKWDAGCPLLHNEMADELLEENQDVAKVISKPVLLAALKPTAAKYGKVRGLKGIRKEKLPPK